MPFCTSCGKEIAADDTFCEYCGAPTGVPPASPVPPAGQQTSDLEGQAIPSGAACEVPLPGSQDASSPSGSSILPATPDRPHRPSQPVNRSRKVAFVAVVIVLVVAAAGVTLFLRPAIFFLPGLAPVSTPVPTTIPTTVTPFPATPVTTTVPTTVPDPFPNAYSLRQWFTYNEGNYASKATVYRYWINETYHWHNDKDNHYYTEPKRPDPNSKYLLVSVNIVNLGTTAYPYPKSNMVFVHYNGKIYTVDTTHYIPDKAEDVKATPIEIYEIQQQSNLFNSEYVSDYGYSHGTTSDFIYPGQSNAIDGYLIYKVPASLTADNTYVEIVFDGEDRAVWKLA